MLLGLVIGVGHWGWSLGLVIGVGHWGWSLGLVIGVGHWGWSLVIGVGQNLATSHPPKKTCLFFSEFRPFLIFLIF